MVKKIKVVELFAGVGGFRLGLEGLNSKSPLSNYKNKIATNYTIVWSNQWEPSTKTQHASLVYEKCFGCINHSNQDISTINPLIIPDFDLLVGGFPCQDYSVATSLKNSKGLIGKKGVLWWSLYKIISSKNKKPKYLFLENVDRLLISPSKQRGRDFAIILKSLNNLGYAVEWRIINAADYGFPQRRKRIYILAYLKGTTVYKKVFNSLPIDWLLKDGIFSKSYPVFFHNHSIQSKFKLQGDIFHISKTFNLVGSKSVFENSGIMINGVVNTIKTYPNYSGKFIVLNDIIENENISNDLYISKQDEKKWRYLKGSKKELRTNSGGFQYVYSEGKMAFPDSLDKPARTIITGEGGRSPSRFKHVIKTKKGFRRLSPIELERLNMFPDNHTKLEGISDSKRAFFMGNALVVGVIEKIANELYNRITR